MTRFFFSSASALMRWKMRCDCTAAPPGEFTTSATAGARFTPKGLQWLAAGWVLALLWVRTLFRFYARVAKSNFPFKDCVLAPLGLPLMIYLLYRSWFQHRVLKQVSWKGRSYAQ